MPNLEEERLLAQQNVQRVKHVGRALGGTASLVGLKAFNAMFRPRILVIAVVLVGAAVWGASAYFDFQERQASQQRYRDQMADQFAYVVRSFEDRTAAWLTEADIRNGRCTYGKLVVECVYGTFVALDGKLQKQ